MEYKFYIISENLDIKNIPITFRSIFINLNYISRASYKFLNSVADMEDIKNKIIPNIKIQLNYYDGFNIEEYGEEVIGFILSNKFDKNYSAYRIFCIPKDTFDNEIMEFILYAKLLGADFKEIF